MSHNAKPPTTKELRSFGFILAGGFPLMFGLVAPWSRGHAWPWIVGGLALLLALAAPAVLRPFYYVWMKIGLVLGWINTRIILTVCFYLLITPVGLVMRLAGKDPMHRHPDDQADSYRKPSEELPPERMKAPY